MSEFKIIHSSQKIWIISFVSVILFGFIILIFLTQLHLINHPSLVMNGFIWGGIGLLANLISRYCSSSKIQMKFLNDGLTATWLRQFPFTIKQGFSFNCKDSSQYKFQRCKQ